jgi:hypothetical protein
MVKIMIIGYARISVADNLNNTSLITQENIIKNYFETHRLKLNRFFSEITSYGFVFYVELTLILKNENIIIQRITNNVEAQKR